MKNIILLLILIGLGSWYYYDKNGTFPFLSEKVEQKDPRIDEIKALGEKYFPTRLEDRERWISTEITAMRALDKKLANISDTMYAELLAEAVQKYPDKYSSRLSYVRKQCDAYIEVKTAMDESSFSSDEKSTLSSMLQETFKRDYAKQCDVLSQVFDVYGMMKSKSLQMNPKDFNKLLAMAMPHIVNDPNKALLLFEEQALARHNFLTKQLPESSANLRADIEKQIPNDFVAQLKELNSRLDESMCARDNSANFANLGISKNAQEFFKKYIYLMDTSARTYNVSFAMMNGKKVIILPSEIIKYTGGTINFNLGGGETIHFNKLFLSCDSAFVISVLENENKIEPIKFAKKEELFKNEPVSVEIVGVQKDGKKATLSGKLDNGELTVDARHLKLAMSWLSSGALVIDRKTGTALGLFELEPNCDYLTYESYDNPSMNDLISDTSRSSLWVGLNKSIHLIRTNCMINYETYKCRIVHLDDMKKFSRLDIKKYKRQKALLDDICAVNRGAISFMLEGYYGADAKMPILKDITKKFNSTFITGSRCTVTSLQSNFLKYMNSVRAELRIMARLAREPFDEFYYEFAKPASRQVELYKALDSSMGATIAQGQNRNILHRDIASSIDGSSYIPPQRIFDRPTKAKAIAGGLRIGNKGIKKDYNVNK